MKTRSALIRSIRNDLWALGIRFRRSDKKINIQGKILSHSKTNSSFNEFISNYITDRKGPNLFAKIVSSGKWEYYVSEIWDELWEFHNEQIAERITGEAIPSTVADADSVLKNFQYSNCLKIRDIVSGKEIIFNTKLQMATDLDVSSWEKSLTKEERHILESTLTIRARLQYEPYLDSPRGLTSYLGDDIQIFNTYVPPYWKKLEPPENVKLPEIVKKYLAHLFPDKESREFVFDWIYTAMTSRNQTYLVLNSNMGTGKNTLVELIKNLVGASNTFSFSVEYFDSRFNSEIAEKRLVFLDEVPINERTKDKLKYMINDVISIEAKGQDPRQCQNFASFIVASNHDHNVRLVPNDRRFSLPEITDIPLNQAMSDLEMAELYRLIRSDDILDIAQWFMKRGQARRTKIMPHLPYKGDKFWHLCHESMPEWMKFVVSKLTTEGQEILMYKELKLGYKVENGDHAQFGSPAKLKAYLTDYLNPFKETYGTVLAATDGDYKIQVNPRYLDTVKDESLEQDDFDI